MTRTEDKKQADRPPERGLDQGLLPRPDDRRETDNARRAKKTKVINAGRRANTKLQLRLRSRLSDALSGAELLPIWFVAVLGSLAPDGAVSKRARRNTREFSEFSSMQRRSAALVGVSPTRAFVTSDHGLR